MMDARDVRTLMTWGVPDPTRLARLAGIRQPVLVANGDNDIMVPIPNSYMLAGHLARRPPDHLPGRRPRLRVPVPCPVRCRGHGVRRCRRS
jgi:hypothetical protein